MAEAGEFGSGQRVGKLGEGKAAAGGRSESKMIE